MSTPMHPLASQPLPIFISRPGETDYLLIAMALFLLAFVIGIGLLYLRLHTLPDRIAHNKGQLEIVCVLGLLAMFTQIHAFWIAALLLAVIDIPDVFTPLTRMAAAVQRLALHRIRKHGARAG